MKTRLTLTCLLTASLLVFFTADVRAQWTWLYPAPQGNSLRDVAFLSDQTAIAVGDVGTIMVSHDAGLTWASSFRINGVSGALRRIARIDDVTAVVVGGGGVILKTTDAGAIWVTIPGGTTNHLIDVSFAEQVGIAVGGEYPHPTIMLRSADRGNTWAPVGGVPRTIGVVMATPTVGYCKDEFSILKTTDGGLTWAYLPNAPSGPRYWHSPGAFSDAMNGAFVGFSGIYVTHDGGVSWSQRTLGSGFEHFGWSASDIEFTLPGTIQVSVIAGACDVATPVCSSWGQFHRSTNDGVSWAVDSATRVLNGVAVNEAGLVLVVGDAGNIYRWVAPGTWQQTAGIGNVQDNPPLEESARLAFRNDETGFMLGSGTDEPANPYDFWANYNVFLRTTTGGGNWDFSYTDWAFTSDVTYAVNSNEAFGITARTSGATRYSQLLKTIDNGATWSPVWSSASDLGLVALEFSSATHGVAVGPSGHAAVIDGGAVITHSIPSGIRGLAFADDNVVVAAGSGTTRIIRSIDGGATWSPIASPLAQSFTDVGFADAMTGVIVGGNGSILRTLDAGETWTPVTSPTTQYLQAVAFSGSYGLAVGGWDGAVLETVDAGLTWVSFEAPTGPISDVIVFGPHHALLAGPELTVLEYRENTVPTLFSSFGATARDFAAELRWTVQTDADLQGFRLARDGVVRATLTSDARSFCDESLNPGTSYEYVLVAWDRNGEETRSIPVRVMIPAAPVELLPNHPNPFNPVTTVSFVVPAKMPVQLTVHDVAGRIVATLVNDVRDAGIHRVDWNAEGMASGVYFTRLRAGKTEVSQKMVLLK